jgi:hypothetical protein
MDCYILSIQFTKLKFILSPLFSHSFRLALSKGPNRRGISLPSPEDGKRSVSETLLFLVFRIPDEDEVQKASDSEVFI